MQSVNACDDVKGVRRLTSILSLWQIPDNQRRSNISISSEREDGDAETSQDKKVRQTEGKKIAETPFTFYIYNLQYNNTLDKQVVESKQDLCIKDKKN